MRHYMVDPDNGERLLKIPPDIVAAIKAEAYSEGRAMTDLERLTETLDALNVAYEKTASASTAGINIILGSQDDEGTVPNTGYANFVWIFTFDAAGKMKEVGGYE